MDKRHLHHLYTRLRVVSYWYFLIAMVIFAVVAAFALRQNNLTALSLRDEVLQVDKDNGNTEVALTKLRTYIYGHMNTDLASNTSIYPPIQLKYRYDRLVAAEKTRVDQLNSHNNLYNDAQVFCEKNFPQSFFGAGRLPCIQNYLDTHAAPPLVQAQQIPDGLYKFNFASPLWSPDLAGWSVVFAGLFGLLFVIRFALERWFIAQFNRHM